MRSGPFWLRLEKQKSVLLTQHGFHDHKQRLAQPNTEVASISRRIL
jgi:hypothetical protein